AGPTTVGVSAFEGCSALQRVEFADGLTKLDYRAFGNCHSLGIVALPASLTEIGGAAFEDLGEDGGQYDLKIVAPDGSFAAKYAERNGFRRAAPEE
ncbi:MAG: leucine-rich repeat protein, partial [Thermoguttaceae bacterium]|nr:leucine-rich repeat protein [Thermoguttaceae bacterium]